MTIQAGTLAYIRREKVKYKPLKAARSFKKVKEKVPFLWGDAVYVISTNSRSSVVSAKGHHFRIENKDLMEEGIFCLWQIDCGQGDAGFIRFPNGKTMLIDCGPGPMMSNSAAEASSFLFWMRHVDQSWRDEFKHQDGPFQIDAVVCSHPDYDHFGGFLKLTSALKSGWFSFGTVYHNGQGRFNGTPTAFKNGKGMSQLGPVEGLGSPELYLTTLLDGFDDVDKYKSARGGRKWKLSGSYATWLTDLLALQGQGVGRLQRVHSGMGTLPDFDAGPDATVKVLGPVDESWKGKPALRYIDRESKSSMEKPSLTRNGMSVVLRIDYGDVRMLMTGDLNFNSQALLLHHIPAVEFKCHVAKACHHGSEDVSTTFLQAMAPMATLFSSGDNETHAHPRAKVLGMAGAYTPAAMTGKKKFLDLEERKYVAPLIYSTELSRSVQLFKPAGLERKGKAVRGATLKSKGAGGRSGPKKKVVDWLLVDSLVYGLINVRTDGKKVVIGVLKEGEGEGFQVESFRV